VKLEKIRYRNFGLQVFSLLLAVVVWFYINTAIGGGPRAYKDIKDVEIQIMGEQLSLGKNLFVVELERNTIDVRISGPSVLIDKLTRNDITAYVNVSGLKPGRTYSPVVSFILPPNVEIVGAPPLVRVEIKDKNI